MKKSIVVALVCFFGLTQMNAQVTFKPGIRAGLNFAHFSKGDNNYYSNSSSYYDNNTGQYVYTTNKADYPTKTAFYIGGYGALKLTKYYTLQPEISYSAQGSNYDLNNKTAPDGFEVSYLSLGLLNKFTFTDKFNVHLGTTLDFVVDENFNEESGFDMAFQLGAGYNFTPNFGIEARVKKGIIPVFDDFNDYHTNVVFQLGATYSFDVK